MSVTGTTAEKTQLKFLSKLAFKNPAEYLRLLRRFERVVALSKLSYHQRALRKHGLRVHKEQREAALLCCAFAALTGDQTYEFASHEQADYDAVFRCREGNLHCYTLVQLKEVVPSHLDPQASIEREVSKLAKYADSEDLVVGVFVKQQGTFQLRQMNLPKVKVSQVWAFGALSPDQTRWFLFGDMLSEPTFTEFAYPS